VWLDARACLPSRLRSPSLRAGARLVEGYRLIFVSNEKTNNLIILDPKTYQVVKDLKVARRPRDMHFNADHTKLYVACGTTT